MMKRPGWRGYEKLGRPSGKKSRRRQLGPAVAIFIVLAGLIVLAHELSYVERAGLGPVGEKLRSLPVRPRRWTVVIDAGHGGVDAGAKGPGGLVEKNVNLQVALALKHELEARGPVSVVMTRTKDRFVRLGERVRIANRHHGDIFISLHCNAYRSGGVYGYETFYYDDAGTGDVEALATAENAQADFMTRLNLKLAGFMPWLERRSYAEESRQLALLVQQTLVAEPLLMAADRGVKGASFFVLRGAGMPAVLVETGFITNRAEESRLRDPHVREAIARGIADALYIHRGLQRRGETPAVSGRDSAVTEPSREALADRDKL